MRLTRAMNHAVNQNGNLINWNGDRQWLQQAEPPGSSPCRSPGAGLSYHRSSCWHTERSFGGIPQPQLCGFLGLLALKTECGYVRHGQVGSFGVSAFGCSMWNGLVCHRERFSVSWKHLKVSQAGMSVVSPLLLIVVLRARYHVQLWNQIHMGGPQDAEWCCGYNNITVQQEGPY